MGRPDSDFAKFAIKEQFQSESHTITSNELTVMNSASINSSCRRIFKTAKKYEMLLDQNFHFLVAINQKLVSFNQCEKMNEITGIKTDWGKRGS